MTWFYPQWVSKKAKLGEPRTRLVVYHGMAILLGEQRLLTAMVLIKASHSTMLGWTTETILLDLASGR